jgi:hypothetical protein
MQTLLPQLLLITSPGILIALAAMVAAYRVRPVKPSLLAVILAALPALLMCLLFYSLALHMRHSLGAWPTSIGEHGFPPSLLTHASIATNCFEALIIGSIAVWPVAFLLCLVIRRWRVGIYYLGIYASACLVCVGAMLLAPSPFLNWWMD